MQYVHVPELIKAIYQPTSFEQQVVPELYTRLWQAIDHYDLKTDPYILDLRSTTDPEAITLLNRTLLAKHTYCLDQLDDVARRAEVILKDLGITAVEWYVRTCYTRNIREPEQVDPLWMPDSSDKEKKHVATILENIIACDDSQLTPSLGTSPKTRMLLETLRQEAAESFTGIIFAEQRSLAATLAETIKTHPLTAGLFKVTTFVGASTSSKRKANIGDISEISGQQQDLDDFRLGKKNLIVATSVLEEGIDVSSCQTVICFDPPANLVSFIQRRGRARKKGSKFIILLEQGDSTGEPARWHDLEENMKNAYMEELRNVELAATLENQVDFSNRRYIVPSTG